jgi:predicted NBD/HSP70 family sugar kinase
MRRGIVLAIDVGATKLAAGVVRQDGALLSEDRAPSIPRDDAEGHYRTLLDLCARRVGAAVLIYRGGDAA